MKTVLRSPNALKDVTLHDKHKNTFNFPCAQREMKEYNSKNKTKPVAKPIKNKKYTKNGK